MAAKLKTPGVYIQEKESFPGSVVAIETALPAFIGYTEKASENGKSLLNKPVKISSLGEYHEIFGGPFKSKFRIGDPPVGNNSNKTISINGSDKVIDYVENNKAFMYPGIKHFYMNGGGNCYIVSVGTYEGKHEVLIDKDELLGTIKIELVEDGKTIKKNVDGGLRSLLKEQEPTIIVVPDAVNLPGNECYEVYVEVLKHCAKMQSRVAILDVKDGFKKRENKDGDIINRFRENIDSENLSYAAAYYPWLNTNVIDKKDVRFDRLAMNKSDFEAFFTEKNAIEFLKGIKKKSPEDEGAEPLETTQNPLPSIDLSAFEISPENYHLGLLATSPTYSDIIDGLWAKINLLPPSSAMAGIYTVVDNTRGVWKSPANISVSNVLSPAVNITHDEQEDLNVDAMSGKSINAIRTFPGVGTLVWGGRTLDGNSLDWRYINVRRTMIMLEQSIKFALYAYTFEPNDANTWVNAKSMIVNFLTEQWKQGALAGATPSDAFDVQVGLGSTMTSLDIMEGRMLVTVKMAITRPAEFIVVTFEQEMTKS